MKVIERNLQEIGKSLLVTLPKEWTRSLNLTKGSKIRMAVSGEGNLLIAPEFVRTVKKKETTLVYDSAFIRQFFKEYFRGNEQITILIKDKIPNTQRKSMYSFLKNFMNIQIIEDSPGKVVVKCFRIDELSMQECLRRMFYLSLNMMDEAFENNDKVKVIELEHNLTKFYYMLVMQIRRFLSEGRYAEQRRLTLLDAMDYRMVAEKVERIGDVVKEFDKSGKVTTKIMGDVKTTYRKAGENFLSRNYDKALELFIQEREMISSFRKRLERSRQANDLKTSRQLRDLIKILNYSREISMLVR